MRLLLTSGGIKNPSIEGALVDLLGKPISQSSALFVPTAILPFAGGPLMARHAICGTASSPLCELGWASLGVLEPTALPSIKREHWVSQLQQSDALLVWGGDVLYLHYWMRKSGLAELLPSLENLVYVGVSAGSIVMTAYNYDIEFNLTNVPEGSDRGEVEGNRGLGFAPGFTLVPHFRHPDFEDSTPEAIKPWAAQLPVPTYGIDDQTAIKVVDGQVDVISEGTWELFGD
jgi:dipeptidase E